MAITLNSTPDKFTPAFNPVHFSVSSDNYSQPDFKFVADVYDGSGNLLATLKYQANVQGSTPISIDVNRMLHELVGPDYCKLNGVVSPAIVVDSGGAIAGYSVQFGEQYGGVVYANLTSFSGYAFNGSMNFYKFAFYDSANWLNEKFLTPLSRQTVRKRDSVMLSILQSDDTAITNFAVNIFSAAGASLYSTTVTNTLTSLSATNNRLLHLHVGFDYLYAQLAFGSTVYAGAAYYTITPNGGTAMRFDLFSRCERFPGVRLYFLNELGGFDSFNFLLPDRYTQTNERKMYQRQPANKQTAYDATNKRFEATNRSYHTRYTEKMRLSSDYLTDTEAQHLLDLIPSPLVYMEKDAAAYGGSGLVLVPVDIKMTDYAVKKTALDKLFNADLDVELTQATYRQTI